MGCGHRVGIEEFSGDHRADMVDDIVPGEAGAHRLKRLPEIAFVSEDAASLDGFECLREIETGSEQPEVTLAEGLSFPAEQFVGDFPGLADRMHPRHVLTGGQVLPSLARSVKPNIQ